MICMTRGLELLWSQLEGKASLLAMDLAELSGEIAKGQILNDRLDLLTFGKVSG
jgi:hypothetical protein